MENVKEDKKELGTVFDIKQMAVFDGPGIRTTVFLKGCPLRCMWCHNPEGLSTKPQIMRSPNGCLHCGRCRAVCPHPEGCVLCGACIRACPKHLIHMSGKVMSSEELCRILRKDEQFLKASGGGVTFSGGEPTAQASFLLDCLDRLEGMHRCIETCGYTDSETFRQVVRRLDYVIMDIKMIDPVRHKHYTGVDNAPILKNLEILKRSGKPFRIRIPVIPGVNDDDGNFQKTAALLKDAENLDYVELLPYHTTAGAKYSMLGMKYQPDFPELQAPRMRTEIFLNQGVACREI
jgi:pyruvate formate lyase activating enzyme